jgi:thiamine-phosphate pyrophosphorylase
VTAPLRLPRSRGLVCVITDRRRLCPTGGFERERAALVDQARAAAGAGADIIQVRERGLTDRELVELVAEIVGAAAGSTMRVLVNDRVDVAVGAGAHGVHLRGDGIAVSEARELAGESAIVGRSVHSREEIRTAAAQGADFVLFGTVFPSASKPSGHAVAGVAGVMEAVRGSGVPVLAVGGITADNVRAVAGAGAHGIAAIGLFATRNAGEMRASVEKCRQSFDSIPTGI